MPDAFFTSGSCYILLCNQFFFIYCVGVLQNHCHFFVSKMSCWMERLSNMIIYNDRNETNDKHNAMISTNNANDKCFALSLRPSTLSRRFSCTYEG